MEYMIKLVKYLEDSGLLLKEVSETVQNEVKERKSGIPIRKYFNRRRNK